MEEPNASLIPASVLSIRLLFRHIRNCSSTQASALAPGEAGLLPARHGAAMPHVVLRTFEAVGDIEDLAVTILRRQLGGGKASHAGAAQEVDLVVRLDLFQLQIVQEVGIDGHA